MAQRNMPKPHPPMIKARHPPAAPGAARRTPAACVGGEASAQSTALFIAQMTAELAGLARVGRFGVLRYLLEMARLEAEIHCLRADAPERASTMNSYGFAGAAMHSLARTQTRQPR